MDKDFEIGEALAVGWEATKANFPLLAGIQLTFFVLTFVPITIGQVLVQKSPLFGAVFILAGYLIQFILLLGMVKITTALANNGEASYGDLFSEAGRIFTFLGATIIFYVGTMLGALLLIIPGVILMVGWCFYPYAVVVNEAGVVSALTQSWELTRGVRLKLFGLLIVMGLLMIAGMLACFVGIFVAGPVTFIAWAHVFLRLSNPHGVDAGTVKPSAS